MQLWVEFEGGEWLVRDEDRANRVVFYAEDEDEALAFIDRQVADDQPQVGIALRNFDEVDWGIFTDYDQASQHLYGRYVRFDDSFAYVDNINRPLENAGKGKICIVKSDNTKEIADVDDERFHRYTYDPLGWVNTDHGAKLVGFRPIRQTRRGYGAENVQCYSFPRDGQAWLEPEMDLDLRSIFYSKGAKEMIRGEYPSFAAVIEQAFAMPMLSVAIDRLYTVQADNDGYVWLWYMDNRIGYVVDPNTVLFGRRWGFLREQIEESNLFDGVVFK